MLSSFKPFQGLGGVTQHILTFAVKKNIMDQKIVLTTQHIFTFAVKQSIIEKKIVVTSNWNKIMVQKISHFTEDKHSIYIKKIMIKKISAVPGDEFNMYIKKKISSNSNWIMVKKISTVHKDELNMHVKKKRSVIFLENKLLYTLILNLKARICTEAQIVGSINEFYIFKNK